MNKNLRENLNKVMNGKPVDVAVISRLFSMQDAVEKQLGRKGIALFVVLLFIEMIDSGVINEISFWGVKLSNVYYVSSILYLLFPYLVYSLAAHALYRMMMNRYIGAVMKRHQKSVFDSGLLYFLRWPTPIRSIGAAEGILGNWPTRILCFPVVITYSTMLSCAFSYYLYKSIRFFQPLDYDHYVQLASGHTFAFVFRGVGVIVAIYSLLFLAIMLFQVKPLRLGKSIQSFVRGAPKSNN